MPSATGAVVLPELDRQWLRLVAILARTGERGNRALECHARAAVLLDAASYELDRLAEELAGVLGCDPRRGLSKPIPARVVVPQIRDVRATVPLAA